MRGPYRSDDELAESAIGTEDGPWRVRVINVGTGALSGVGTVFALESPVGSAVRDHAGTVTAYNWTELFQNDGNFSYLSDSRSWEVYVDGARLPSGSTLRALNVRSDSAHRPKVYLPQPPASVARVSGFHKLGWYTIESNQIAAGVTGYLHVEWDAGEWRETVYEPAGTPLIWPQRPEFNDQGMTKPEVRWKIKWLGGQAPPNLAGWPTHVYYSSS